MTNYRLIACDSPRNSAPTNQTQMQDKAIPEPSTHADAQPALRTESAREPASTIPLKPMLDSGSRLLSNELPTAPAGMPPIAPVMLARWRRMLGTLCETLGMCNGRIWSLSGTQAEVIIAHGSPLPGEGMRVAIEGSKLLYQSVVQQGSTLDVASPQWPTSSEARQGVKDYLGLPLSWPDGTVFGVIEVLTSEPRPFTSLHRRLATQVRDNIEDHLQSLAATEEQTWAKSQLQLERDVRALAAQTAAFGTWFYDRARDALSGDADWQRLLGLDSAAPATALAAFKALIHPEDVAAVSDNSLLGLAESDGGDEDTGILFRIVRPDGETRWMTSSARPVDDLPDRVVGVLLDVTDSHVTHDALRQGRTALIEAEAVLRDIRERLQLAAQTNGLGISEWNVAASALHCDANMNAILGLQSGSPRNAAEFCTRIHPEDRRLFDVTALAKGDGNGEAVQFRIVRPTGEVRFVSCTTHWSEATATLPRRLRGFVTDVTEARRAQEERERDQAALEQTEEVTRLANWRFDRATGQFSASAMLNRLNARAADAPPLTQTDLEQLLSPKSQDGATSAVQHCLKTGQPYAFELHYTRPDGTSFPAQVRGRAERDAKGAIIGVTGTVQDVSERQEGSARIAALADALPLGAIYRFQARDGQFVLTQASAGIEALLGVPEAALLADGAAFLEAIGEPGRMAYLPEFERAVQTGDVFDCRFLIERGDGLTTWLHSRAVSRTLPDGSTVWEAILWDVSEERRAAEALREAGEVVAAKGRAQVELLATMARDLRPPMNTIIGTTRLALQTELTGKQRSYLDKIASATDSVRTTLTDVVDYSQVEAGSLILDDADFTFEAVLEAVAGATAARAEEKGLELAFAIGPDVLRGWRGDGRRLSQVLTTLAANAVRCTQAGEVVVSIDRLAGGSDAAPQLQFCVRDTGSALDDDQVTSLFQPFAPVGSRTSPRYGDSGLKLALSQLLVQRMGGIITVESQEGGDTAFSFTLSLPEATTAAKVPSAAFGERRVLVVDDNASARTILADLLRSLGLVPETAASGTDALAALGRAAHKFVPFDLVLADWRMPSMDGLDLARRIRADEALSQTPVVLMLTGARREDVMRRVTQLGVKGVLNKPATAGTLFAAVQSVFVGQGKGHNEGRSVEQTMALLAERRVLLVVRETAARDGITDALEVAGMAADTAASADEALDRLAGRAYDAVLLDMQLPGLEGRNTARRIRRNAAWVRLPIIAMTTPAGMTAQEVSAGAGISARLAKPVDTAKLYTVLADSFTGTQPVDAIVPPDFELALRRQNGDPERLGRLLRGFLRDFADIPAKLSELIGTDDLPEAAALAQLVLSAASSLEARQLAAAAGQLEQAARDGARDIDAIAQEFRRQLLAALDAVSARLAQDSRIASAALANDRETTLALIARVEPLAARGDRAASTALKQLATLLQGQAQGR